MNMNPVFEPDLTAFGYAPGGYDVRCVDLTCETVDPSFGAARFIGDKRAWRCKSCALRAYEAKFAGLEVKEIGEFEFVEDDYSDMAGPVVKRLSRDKVRAPQLTRDNLPARNENEKCRRVDTALTVALLVAKLHSEAEEIALDLTNPEEYGDLLETLASLGQLNGVSFDQIHQAAIKKAAKKGSLVGGNFWVPKDFF
jgi:predicted house-cleaning noncanonical NTP pyrophosphatase (MazG superfamily)